jgi:hypothetical protein
VGALPAVLLGTALERGGTITAASKAFGELAIDAVLVVRTVGGERSDGIIDLIKQRADLRAVIDVVGHQRRRDHYAIRKWNVECRGVFATPAAAVGYMLIVVILRRPRRLLVCGSLCGL